MKLTKSLPKLLFSMALVLLVALNAQAQSSRSSNPAQSDNQKVKKSEAPKSVSGSQIDEPAKLSQQEKRQLAAEITMTKQQLSSDLDLLKKGLESNQLSKEEINNIRMRIDQHQSKLDQLSNATNLQNQSAENADPVTYWQNKLNSLKPTGNQELDQMKKELIMTHIEANKSAKTGDLTESKARELKNKILSLESKIASAEQQ